MNDLIASVVNACADLHESGKQPSVALLKSKLSNSVSLPQLVKGLSVWKDNPQRIVISKTTKNKALSNNRENARIAALEDKVDALEHRILELERQLDK